jgi:hypothetical protein
MQRYLNPYDEGLVTVNALRILNGDVPYRDFWVQHAPGQFYVLAFLFKIFGPSVAVERCWDISLRAGISVTSFLIIAEWAPRRYALPGWAICNIWLAYLGFHGFALFPALLFCLLSAYVVSFYFKGGGRLWRALVAGLCTGLAATFRHDLGFYMMLANMAILSGYALVACRSDIRDTSPWALAAPLAAFSFGVLLICGPIVATLLWAVPRGDLIFSLLTVPSQIYPSVRSLPFPSSAAIARQAIENGSFTPMVGLFVCWPLLVAAAVIPLWTHIGPGGRSPKHHDANGGSPVRWSCLLLVLALLLLYVKGVVRVSPLHMTQSIVFAIVLLCVLAGNLRSGSRFSKAVLAICAVTLAIPCSVAIATVLSRANENVLAILHLTERNPCNPTVGLEAMRCFETSADSIQAMSYVVAHTTGDEMIFVGAGRHDKIFVNDVMFYFVTRRRPVTKWHQLHPGVQTAAPIQAAMVAEFRLRKPRYVVLDARWDAASEPNASAISSGVTLLDDFIRGNYQHVASFGPISISRAVGEP